MPAVRFATVAYVTRVEPTRRDPRGLGPETQVTNPANFGRLPAIVQRVLGGERAAIVVHCVPSNFGVVCDKFDPLNPKYGTWEPVSP